MSKNRIKAGIYLCAVLMMGVIAVSSNLTNISQAFPDVPQTTIVSYMVSAPCLVIIFITLLSGRLMGIASKRTLMIIGVSLWCVGGVMPFFLDSLPRILIMRLIFGAGVGMVQALCPAIAAENFESKEERSSVMGNITAFQMLGGLFFSVISGNLGRIYWKNAFLVHLIAVVSLSAAVFLLPKGKRPHKEKEHTGFHPTVMMWIWCAAFFVLSLGAQAYSNNASAVITWQGIGGTSESGYSLAVFALGGLIMGFLFSKVEKIFKRLTLTAGSLIVAASYLLIVFASDIATSCAGAFIFGLAYAICMPCILSGTTNSVETASSGMALSVATSLQNAGMMLSPYAMLLGSSLIFKPLGFPDAAGSMLFGALILAVLAFIFIFISFGSKKERP